MIKHYEINIKYLSDYRPDASTAYRLYSALLANAPYDYVETLHNQEITPVSQHLSIKGSSLNWIITLFGEQSCDFIGSVIDNNSTIETDDGAIDISDKIFSVIPDDSALLTSAASLPDTNLWSLRLSSPTTFKSGGDYVLFPSSDLIVKSMISKLNALSESVLVEDEQAVAMLLDGVRISSYRLNTSPFFLKGQTITGFSGQLTLKTRLSPPIMELWKLLVSFAGYSGIGIKTALGMGGCTFLPIKH